MSKKQKEKVEIRKKKDIRNKIKSLELFLDEAHEQSQNPGLMPNEINKLYDVKLQVAAWIDALRWVLQEGEQYERKN